MRSTKVNTYQMRLLTLQIADNIYIQQTHQSEYIHKAENSHKVCQKRKSILKLDVNNQHGYKSGIVYN